MKTRKSRFALGLLGEAAVLGVVALSISACADPYSPSRHTVYQDGYYSTYEYPSDYHYYHDRYYYDNCSSYRGDANCPRDDRNDLNHTHDLNFHNRDDYDHYDR